MYIYGLFYPFDVAKVQKVAMNSLSNLISSYIVALIFFNKMIEF